MKYEVISFVQNQIVETEGRPDKILRLEVPLWLFNEMSRKIFTPFIDQIEHQVVYACLDTAEEDLNN